VTKHFVDHRFRAENSRGSNRFKEGDFQEGSVFSLLLSPRLMRKKKRKGKTAPNSERKGDGPTLFYEKRPFWPTLPGCSQA